MSLQKDIPELLKGDIISQETADRILEFYKNKGGQSQNRLFIVFGILGAILVGLGVISIIAHNWDDLSHTVKTILAFIPLLSGQAICLFVLLKKKDSQVWKESSTAFLFFAVGACISLVSQIYNIPGNLSSYLLVWMLLCLPLVYVMRSSIVSLLYILGITYYACETGYWSYPSSESYIYWLLLVLVLPYYYVLFKKRPTSNFMTFHNWIIPISLVITVGTLSEKMEELMFIAYFSLFGLYYLIGNMNYFRNKKLKNNGYLVLGSLGTLILLLTLSFDWFWEELRNQSLLLDEVVRSPEFMVSVILTLSAGWILIRQLKKKSIKNIKPIEFVFVLFILLFLMGLWYSLTVVLINILIFIISILTIREGAKQDHLGILNYGLLIITVLVVCRFFDTDLNFITRGLLFVTVGVGFFATNYWMLKKRKANEK